MTQLAMTNKNVRKMAVQALNHAYALGVSYCQIQHFIVSSETGRQFRTLLRKNAALLGYHRTGSTTGQMFLKGIPVVVLPTYKHSDILVVPKAKHSR